MSAPFAELVRLRAGELAGAAAARVRSSPVPSPASIARAAARVATAQAEYLHGRVLAFPAEVRVRLPPAGFARVAGALPHLEAEVAERAWQLAVQRSRPGPVAARFTVRIGVDPARRHGFTVSASRSLGALPAPAPAASATEPSTARYPDGGTRALRLRFLGGRPSVDVAVGGVVHVGRGRRNDLVVADPRVSGRHLTVGWRGAVPVARDLGSTNGTWHNGRRVLEAPLGDGDRLRVGRTVLVVELPGDPAARPATAPAGGPTP